VALSPGTRVGSYQIVAPLGKGGMGEVYRARDLILNRTVAIKILPDGFGADTDRVARFQREAQVLASLNHPHIAAIYGVEEVGDPSTHGHPARALILELVEGDTLAVRIRRGRLPVADALALARQLTDALEAAHERGIVHRDLKPANIIVTPDGAAKVLDFGLAKITSAEPFEADSSHSPTLTVHGTREGVILGTAGYMSPEQAKGRAADRRADVWSFGVILFEMLTATRLFEGGDVSTTLAQVLTKEPEWDRLPADLPAPILRLLRRCLEKDPRRRLDSAAVARMEIDEGLSPATARGEAPARLSARRAAVWAIASAAAAALITIGITRSLLQTAAQEPAVTSRFAITQPPSQQMPPILLDRDLAISPDGRRLVYRVGGSTAGGPLALRSLDALEARVLPGIDNARAPFFSPDGRWIGFFTASEQNAGAELKKISTEGGLPISLGQGMEFGNASATWSTDDTIVVASTEGRLLRVPAAGGAPAPIDSSADEPLSGVAYLSMLPAGRGVLFTSTARGTWFTDASDAQVAVLDLKSGERKVLIRGSAPTYVPASADTGYLVFASERTLFAIRFDLNDLSVRGDPVPLVDDVAMAPLGAVNYDVARNGTLVYVPSAAAGSRSLVWVDRNGRETPAGLPSRAYAFVRLAPDGTKAAVTTLEDRRIWIGDLRRHTLRRLTLGSSDDGWPIWTRDSRAIIFNSNREGGFNLYLQPADGSGSAVRLTTGPNYLLPNSLTPDGRHLIAAEGSPQTFLDVVLLQASGAPQTGDSAADSPALSFAMVRPVVKSKAREYNGIASPDGRFFAYQSNESGRSEVYVKPLTTTSEVRWQVSTAGGSSPLWAPKGGELYYRDLTNAVLAVPYEIDGITWHAGTPTTVLDSRYAAPTDMFNYDISPDGQRFLMFKDTGRDATATTAGIVIVLNWVEELRRRLPAS